MPTVTSSPLMAPLVVPSALRLDDGQQLVAAMGAARENPSAVVAREESQAKYENLDPSQAAKAVADAFPAMSVPAGGLPQLPSGQRITGFANPDVAQLTFSDGGHGLVTSSVPIALRKPSGAWDPVNLSLHEANGAFEPTNPAVATSLPKHLADGATLPTTGVTITPVDAQGTPLHGAEGVSDGADVFYANTETDADTVFKPSPLGLDATTILRGIDSPEQLYFHVDLPADGQFIQTPASAGGAIEVVQGGTRLGVLRPPTATDASGMAVPASMSVSGDTVIVTVDHRTGSYAYPIAVDPEFNTTTEAGLEWTSNQLNWHFSQAGGYTIEVPKEPDIYMIHTGSYGAGDWGLAQMQTQGYTKIYAIETHDEFSPAEGTYYSGALSFPPGTGEYNLTTAKNPFVLIWASEAGIEAVPNNNAVSFEMTSLESGSATFAGEIWEPKVYIAEQKGRHSEAKVGTAAELEYTSEGKKIKTPNVLTGTNWLGPHSGAIELIATDEGLGVEEQAVELYGTSGWEQEGYSTTFGRTSYHSSGCIGIQCTQKETQVLTYNALESYPRQSLPNGEDRIRPVARSAMPGSSSSAEGGGAPEHIVKVDNQAPTNIVLSGLPSVEKKIEREGKVIEYPVYQLGEVEGHLTVEATDGEKTTPSSGVHSIGLEFNGHAIGAEGGSCTPGPCTASHEWALNGAELGAGSDTLTVVATDNAGNVKTETFHLNVYHATPVAEGPGSVNPESGDYALETTDVNLSGAMEALTVSRHYDSRNLTEGSEGPLGPQWTIGLGSLAKLEVLPDGSVMLIGREGLTHFAEKEGGGFEAPEGDTNLTLTYESSKHSYVVKNPAQGTATEFTQPEGATLFLPTVSKGPATSDTLTDEYKSVRPEPNKVIIEPKLELAPHPNVACGRTELEKLEASAKGCRALEFIYDEGETTAKGEAESQWGAYKDNLKEVAAIAYNPSTKKMTRTAVADYEYDAHGRLRAEWDPRLGSSLKTTYGYDAEGHVTALTPGGQSSWAFTYGTSPGDSSTGRIVKVTRAAAATPLWKGELPRQEGEAASIWGTPKVGVTMAAYTGSWEHEPTVYGFQWEHCTSTCTPIPGAINANYTIAASDVGDTIKAVITATNGGGSVTATTAASGAVTTGASEYALATGSEPTWITPGPDGDLWFTNYESGKVDKMTTSGTIQGEYGGGVQVDGITSGPEGDLWYAQHAFHAIGQMTTKGENTAHLLPLKPDKPVSIVVGPDENLWYTLENGAIGKMNAKGESLAEYELPTGSSPETITVGPDKNLWFTDNGTSKIGKITTAGTITEYALPAGSQPYGIASGPDGNLWFTDYGTSRVGKITTSGTITEYELPAESKPRGIAAVSGANLWFAEYGTSKVGTITTSAQLSEYLLPAGSEPSGITAGPEKNVWFTEIGTNKIGELGGTMTGGVTQPAQPGSTIEYNVPFEGAAAPNQLGLNPETHKPEPEKWGQTDDPVNAAAIFPADEPMKWPATDYRRATITYMDTQARTVNTANPEKGIATTEYNETNEVKRTLTADNRAKALEEAKPGEAAELLDTKDAYNSAGQLTDTWGPQHTVKLAAGKEKAGEEVKARNHMRYFYDEGAPEGETYDLVTKTIDSAELASKEEYDSRTTLTSYHGQGWKLRKPTSVTVDPGGLHLTTTTKYEEGTGNVVEVKMPGSGQATTVAPVYGSKFGTYGTGNGQLKEPQGLALDSKGDTFVADEDNNRVEEFNEKGEFAKVIGSVGTGNGHLKSPKGVAVDSKGNIWVADTENNRVEEFNEKGEYAKVIGTAGTGVLQFKEPKGIAVDSHNNVWIADTMNNRVVELSETGAFVKAIGFGVLDGENKPETCTTTCRAGLSGTGTGELTEPRALAVASTGAIWVADTGNNRLEVYKTTGEPERTVASAGSGVGQLTSPRGIAIDTLGNAWVSDTEDNRIEEFSETGEYVLQFGTKGTGNGQLLGPRGIAADAHGDLYVSDLGNSRVEKFVPAAAAEPVAPAYAQQFGTNGSGSGQLKGPREIALDSKDESFIADEENNRIDVFNEKGEYLKAIGSLGSGNGQLKAPKGVRVDASGNVWVADTGNNRVEQFNEKGEFGKVIGSAGTGADQFKEPKGVAVDAHNNIWIVDAANNRLEELNEKGEFVKVLGFGVANGESKVQTCTSSCRAGLSGAEAGELKEPRGVAIALNGAIWVADTGNSRVEVYKENGEFEKTVGSAGSGNGQLNQPKGIALDSRGMAWVTDSENNRVQEFNGKGEYVLQFGSSGTGNGQFGSPWGIAVDSAGNVFVSDNLNSRVEKFVPGTGPGNPEAHDTKTVYYTAKNEAELSNCREHAEWVGLPCETTPVAQPESGYPALPTTEIKYNMWDQVETVSETVGTTTRTRKTTFDAAGRPTETVESSPIDTELPKFGVTYSSQTGQIETQTSTEGGTTKTVTLHHNADGELTSYTDAEGVTTTYEYENGLDARLKKQSYKIGETTFTQTYGYSTTSGTPSELVDSAAGTFTATQDAEGNMASESYPNGMTAYYAHNAAGENTGIEYKKLTHCTENCVWFSDQIVPSVHGETIKRVSSLSEEPLETYDADGRLTSVQEIPSGEGCTTRLYAYDNEGDRTSLTTRPPGTGGACATEGGTVERHTYDTGNRLADSGVTYETFGNTTRLPAPDAGEHELVTSYYADGQVAKQTQGEESLEYKLDPEGRPRVTNGTGKAPATVTSHYAEPGSTLAWSAESTEKWTRNIPGIGGTLAAVETPAGTVLQLHDLQGDIVATAGLSETETKLLAKFNSTEFGVPPTKSAPPPYAWLGAEGVASELSSGAVTQDGVTYVPQTGRALETEPVVIPVPVNEGVAYVSRLAPWVVQAGIEVADRQVAVFEEQKRLEETSAPVSEGTPLLGGSERAMTGCSGMRACAASTTECQLHWLFGEEPDVPGILQLSGNMQCNSTMGSIEFQECELEHKGSHYAHLKCTKKGWTAYKTSEAGAYISEKCEEGREYKAWVWADAKSGDFWSEGTVNSGEWTCEGFFGEETYEAVETLLG